MKNNPLYGGFIKASLRLIGLFAVLFYSVEYFTAWRRVEISLAMGWERNIPYWEGMFLVYYSVFVLPFVIPHFLGKGEEIYLWEKKMRAAIVLSVLFYLIFPGKNGFHQLEIERTPWILNLSQWMTGEHNMAPSLHVSLCLIILFSCLGKRAGWLKGAALSLWVMALILSTLLTHQHHVLDVLTGMLLAVFINRSYEKLRGSPIENS